MMLPFPSCQWNVYFWDHATFPLESSGCWGLLDFLGNSLMLPLYFLSIFVKLDSVHFKVKNASWVWFLATCFTMRIFLQIPLIFSPYFWLRYSWNITLFEFKPYDWYQTEPCGAPGHKSSIPLSLISLTTENGLHIASMTYPEFQGAGSNSRSREGVQTAGKVGDVRQRKNSQEKQ